MKGQRRTAPRRDSVPPVVEKDEASGAGTTTREPADRRYRNLKLPHERDEVTHPPPRPGPATTQAADDLRAGKRDTDRYTEAGADFDRKDQQD